MSRAPYWEKLSSDPSLPMNRVNTDHLREMPSSLNDACRKLEMAAERIGVLERDVAGLQIEVRLRDQKIRRYSEALAELGSWRPVIDAPRAIGQRILLAWQSEDTGAGYVGEGYWDDGFEGCVNQPPVPAGWCIPSQGFFNVLLPTHWRPLPLFMDRER